MGYPILYTYKEELMNDWERPNCNTFLAWLVAIVMALIVSFAECGGGGGGSGGGSSNSKGSGLPPLQFDSTNWNEGKWQ